MRTPGKLQNPEDKQKLQWRPIQDFCGTPNNSVQTSQGWTNTRSGEFFMLDSSLTAAEYMDYNTPSDVTMSCNGSLFSPQSSNSYLLEELDNSLIGPELETPNRSGCSFNAGAQSRWSTERWKALTNMIPRLELKKVLIACARAVAENDVVSSTSLMEVLGLMVSVSGEPIQRLGAYTLEALRARVECSGSNICKSLNCKEPTSSELISYMHVLYQICPYWKFAYISSNVVIGETMKREPEIHIIDFQIAQGSQWVPLIQALAAQAWKPRHIRITGIDDAQSAYARGGGIDIVGTRLSQVADSCGVTFEFHGMRKPYSEIGLEDLELKQGDALAVNFPFILHHIPDESVTTDNHRDRIIRLVKNLSPKVVTLVEQESNTNTAPFYHRFLEAMDYYTAMFESIHVARPRDDKQRIGAEQHCVARDIVNLIACEGTERVERHELLGKWRSRFTMAGFDQRWLNSSVTNAANIMLKDYSENYKLQEKHGVVYLYWKNRAMATSSAWRVRGNEFNI